MRRVLLIVGLLVAGCGKASETPKSPSSNNADGVFLSPEEAGVFELPNFYNSRHWSKDETKPSGEYHESFEKYQLFHLVFGCHLARCSDRPCKEADNKVKLEKLFNWEEIIETVFSTFEKQRPDLEFLLITVHKKRPEDCQHGTDCQHCFAFTYNILAYHKPRK